MCVCVYMKGNYEENWRFGRPKNKAKQSQFQPGRMVNWVIWHKARPDRILEGNNGPGWIRTNVSFR